MMGASETPRLYAADRVDRLHAALVDALATGMLAQFAGLHPKQPGAERVELIEAWIGGPALVAFLIWQAYGLATRGQTLGKRACDVRVVDAESGARVGFARIVLLRYLPLVLLWPGMLWIAPLLGLDVEWTTRAGSFFRPIEGLCFLLVVVEKLSIFAPQRRCLHDLLAGTRVVRCGKSFARDRGRSAAPSDAPIPTGS